MATKDAAAANRRAGTDTRHQRDTSNRNARVGLIAGAVVVLAAVVAIAVSVAGDGGSRPDSLEDEAANVTVEGQALPAFPDAGPDPAVGQPFPTLSGTGTTGNPMRIEADRSTILVFVAHWCPVCQREVPVLRDWIAAGGAEDVDVLAVSTAFQPAQGNWPTTTWLEEEGWTQPTLLDPDGAAWVASGQRAFPAFVVVDSSGSVVARTTGELSVEQLDALAELARS
jgi:cytochrome c biogenesis protein CcmG, thiol:disulfide interchange protein DsbE